ncbi:MAG: S8 family serine peptidase, partial [Syntrophobacterales bacterium]
FKFCGIIFAVLVLLFIYPVPGLQSPAVHGAEPMVTPADSADDSESVSLRKGRGVAKVESPRVARKHILVQLRPNAAEDQFLQNAKGRGLHRLGRVYGSNWMIMSIPQGAEPRKAANAARMLQNVMRATPDPIVRINDHIPPLDPMYIYDDNPSTKDCDPLWDICDPWDLVDQWGLFKVEAEGGWSEQTGSPEVVIAILDSGVDLDHDDLLGNIWTNPNEIPNDNIDNDGNGFVDDIHGVDFCGNNIGSLDDDAASQDANPDIPTGGIWVGDSTLYPYGWGIRFAGDPAVGDALDNNMDYVSDPGVTHGTFVAGVAAAMTNNENPETGVLEGMAGVCWHCKIMPVRLINAEGWAYGSDAVSAINYAVAKGADVINVSWGIDLSSADDSVMQEIQILEEAINDAVSQGVIVVAAAGNSGTPGLHFPASMPNTIAVGSSNWLGQRSDFSSYAGPGQILDVIAPGELIWSTAVFSAYDSLLYDLLEMGYFEPGTDTYGQADGTSFATPLVSGYVGLILSENPAATLSQVREVIRANAVDILYDPYSLGGPLVGYDPYSGFGEMRMVVPALTVQPNEPPTVTITAPSDGASFEEEQVVTFSATAVDHEDGNISADIEWVSSIDGAIGKDVASFLTSSLSVGTHTITASVNDSGGEGGSDLISVTINANTPAPAPANAPPDADFDFLIAKSKTVSFTDTSTDNDGYIVSWFWEFGDGKTSTAQNPTHRYRSTGSYSVTLTVTDDGGETASITKPVEIPGGADKPKPRRK